MPRYRVELGQLAARWSSIELEANDAGAAEEKGRADLLEHAREAELFVTELADVDDDDQAADER